MYGCSNHVHNVHSNSSKRSLAYAYSHAQFVFKSSMEDLEKLVAPRLYYVCHNIFNFIF